jgi:hypothetical protein
MKKLEDLPKDIFGLFNPDEDHECNEENLDVFAENLKTLLRARLRSSPVSLEPTPLRFSALGKPDRQIWYDGHPEEDTTEKLVPKTYMKFLYGDVIEQLLLFLAKEAGHEVTEEQTEVEVDGIKGHIDAIIDGTVVDVKSASPYGYKKFAEGTVTQDDPFGYVQQLAGYASVLTPGKPAAWLANDKVHGDICVSPLSKIVIDHHPPAERITHLKGVLESDQVPERCHEPVPDGASGNLKLGTSCSYCRHKRRCHPDLRTFLYSTGPRFLVKTVREPNVPEVTPEEVEELAS